MNCSKCGTENYPNAAYAYCKNCGATLSTEDFKSANSKSQIKTMRKIYKHPSGKIEVVKQGWSWPAFFFIWIWAMAKKIWHVGTIVVFSIVILIFMKLYYGIGIQDIATISFIIDGIFAITVGIIFGKNGNFWREKNLLKRGYEFRGNVAAENAEQAIAMFLKSENNNTYQSLNKGLSIKQLIAVMAIITTASIFTFLIGTSNKRTQANYLSEQIKLEAEIRALESLQRDLNRLIGK